MNLSIYLRDVKFDRQQLMIAWELLSPSSLSRVREMEEFETWVYRDLDDAAIEKMARCLGQEKHWHSVCTELLVQLCARLPCSAMTLLHFWLLPRRPDIVQQMVEYALDNRDENACAFVINVRLRKLAEMYESDLKERSRYAKLRKRPATTVSSAA